MDPSSALQGAPFPRHGTAEWLTRGQVAELLQVSITTVTRLAEAGELERGPSSERDGAGSNPGAWRHGRMGMHATTRDRHDP